MSALHGAISCHLVKRNLITPPTLAGKGEPMSDKEKILQLEKDLAICKKTVEKLQMEITVLMQEIMVINPEWSDYIENDP